MAIARAQGKDVIVIHGIFSPLNLVLVRRDSPLETLADLRGKKLGIFGGPSSTTFTFLAVIAKRWHGLDLLHDVELVSAPGPALANLLDRGEVDAALMGTAESLKLGGKEDYRVLVDLAREYATRRGQVPAHVTVATTETFAAGHADLLKDFLAATDEAMTYARSHPAIWARYGEKIGMTAEDEIARLRDEMGGSLVEAWDEEQIAVQKEYLAFTHEILGDEVLPGLPEDLIRDAFNP
jgi:NitT/TauT family transport system substrate-binding protein